MGPCFFFEFGGFRGFWVSQFGECWGSVFLET